MHTISHDLVIAVFELPCPLLSFVCIAHEPLEPRITTIGGSGGVLRSSLVGHGFPAQTPPFPALPEQGYPASAGPPPPDRPHLHEIE